MKIYFLLLLLFIGLLTASAQAHDVKDPVCRMSTDADTTPYRETINGKTYYFCSANCRAKFDQAPTAYVTLNTRLAAGQTRTYHLALTAPPHLDARRPVPLTLTIHETPSGRLVRDFEIVHEKHLHLILVSQDLGWFEHQHPQLGPDGRFRLTWTFPKPGRYFLFADFTPSDGDNQILRATIDIGAAGTESRTALVPDTTQIKTIGGTRVSLTVRPGATGSPLIAGRQALLTYTLSDLSGRPRLDMQPILGVMGHLIAIREDDTTAVHTHALHGVQTGSYGAAMLAMMQAGQSEAVPVTPEMVTQSGPAFTFKLTLPKPGRYKLWAQFQRQNQWLTVPYVVEVE